MLWHQQGCRLRRGAGTGQWRLRAVSVVVAKPAHQRTVAAPGWLLPVFLPAAGGQIEPLVGAVDHVGAPRVAGVDVEDAVAAAQEGTEAVYLAGPPLPVRSELIKVPVVVLDRGHGRVEGDVEVVVKIAAERGVPGHGPAHPLPERLELGQRRPADHGQRGVPGVQVGEVADAVGQERARLAALIPVRVEHEMVDQQLTTAPEQVEQAAWPPGPWKMYSLSISTIGSLRRSVFSASRCRVNSFSCASSSLR